MKKVFISLLFSLLLVGCSSQRPFPETYTAGEDTLPAIQVQEKSVEFSQEIDSETGDIAYLYQGDLSGVQSLADYIQMLESDYNCIAVDENGVPQSLPELSDSSGTAILGMESTTGKGTLLLHICWQPDILRFSPEYNANLDIKNTSEDAKTLEQLLAVLENASPQSLGLTGSSMEEYLVYPEEGYVLVDQKPYVRFNIYQAATHQFEKTFMISANGQHVFQLDRETNQLTNLDLEGDKK